MISIIPTCVPKSGGSVDLDVKKEDRLVGVAGAAFVHSGSTGQPVNASINIETSTNISSISMTGSGNDDRFIQIVFATPVDLPYIVVDSKYSHEPFGDERKQQWQAGSKTSTGFIMEFTVDDNGGTEDPNLYHGGDFVVLKEESIVTNVEVL